MIQRCLLVAALVLTPALALAQTPDPVTTPPDVAAQTAPKGDSPAVFKKGTLGLSFGVATALDFSSLAALIGGGSGVVGPTQIGVTYFLSEKAALDLIVGFRLAHNPDGGTIAMPVAAATKFGLAAGLGYKMYMHHTGKVHSFLEPKVVFSDADFSNFGPTFDLNISGNLGAEVMFTDWFSVSGTIGIGMDFSNEFKNIFVGTVSTGLFANMYWD